MQKIKWADFLASSCQKWLGQGHNISIKKFEIIASWIIQQYKNDYNPIHYHSGQISGVGYLKVPKNMGETVQKSKKNNHNGKLVLIDGSKKFKVMKKSLGSKRKEMSEEGLKNILQSYLEFKENEISKIYENSYFGYTKVQIEQPVTQDGEVVKLKSGKPKPNAKLRDHERIPLNESIDGYYESEVKPYLPNSWMDRSKDKVGYEINFRKQFYIYEPPRQSSEIINELLQLDKDSEQLLRDITNE